MFQPLHMPRALLFDMDGTLTEPLMDFAQIKADMGIGNRPILETLAEMDETSRATALAVLHRHEEFAAANSTLNEGCEDLLRWVDANGFRIAVVTRNSLASARTVFERHRLSIDTLITRDDCVFKPSPDPLLLACRRLDVDPADAWMIGDGRYDVEAGTAAGIRTVWISHGRDRDFDAAPWKTVRDLVEFHQFLKRNLAVDHVS